jgi:hypothetical protein
MLWRVYNTDCVVHGCGGSGYGWEQPRGGSLLMRWAGAQRCWRHAAWWWQQDWQVLLRQAMR